MNNIINHEALLPGSTESGAFSSFNSGEKTSNAMHPHTPITAPEGRVRGGNIVAMLANGMNLGKQSSHYNVEAGTSTGNWL